jgi:hypothetical protein
MVSDRSNGIYRSLIAALIGLTLIGAAPEKEKIADGAQAASEKAREKQLDRIASALEKLPDSATKDAGCKPGQDDRGSDLCAQWKAADAATESAIWAARTFWVGLFGLLIGGGTLIFAASAAHWAKEAAIETRESVKVANANLDAFRKLEDGFILFSVHNCQPLPEQTGMVSFEYKVSNIGRSPVLIRQIVWDSGELTHGYNNELIVSGATYESRFPVKIAYTGGISERTGWVEYDTAIRSNSKVPFTFTIYEHKGRPYVQASAHEPMHST